MSPSRADRDWHLVSDTQTREGCEQRLRCADIRARQGYHNVILRAYVYV